MLQRLNTTKTKEIDSLDDVEKMAYKVNEILLTANLAVKNEDEPNIFVIKYNETN